MIKSKSYLPLVVVGQFGSLGRNTLKKIIDKGVCDAPGLGGDTGIGVDLLQHLVDVDDIGLLTLGFALLAVFGNNFSGLGSLGRDTASRITLSSKSLRTPQVTLQIKPPSNVISQDFLSPLPFLPRQVIFIIWHLYKSLLKCFLVLKKTWFFSCLLEYRPSFKPGPGQLRDLKTFFQSHVQWPWRRHRCWMGPL